VTTHWTDPRTLLPGVVLAARDGWMLTCLARQHAPTWYVYQPGRPGGQARHFLDGLDVTPAQARELLGARSFRTGSRVLTCTLSMEEVQLSGIALEWDEANAIMGGADPLAVLLPPGLRARPLTHQELVTG
jgi:hypothetical protein